MKLIIGRWGMEFQLGGCVLSLYAGDVYLRCPGIGELAWNCTGFHADRPSANRRVALD